MQPRGSAVLHASSVVLETSGQVVYTATAHLKTRGLMVVNFDRLVAASQVFWLARLACAYASEQRTGVIMRDGVTMQLGIGET